MNTLPIEAARGAFEAALASRATVVVAAPTGSGKSTRLPVWMAEASGGPVLVVEPRRVACRALAGWVARGMGESPGGRVGYRVRFQDVRSDRTEILFVTPGVALRMQYIDPAFQHSWLDPHAGCVRME